MSLKQAIQMELDAARRWLNSGYGFRDVHEGANLVARMIMIIETLIVDLDQEKKTNGLE